MLANFCVGCSRSEQKDEMSMKLNVAFPYDKPVNHYEPTRIYFSPEYIFLENVYSPLIELSTANGQPIGGVAEKFQWDEKTNEFYLYIRRNLKTIDGHQITARDAEFSLKRLLVLSSNTHGNFKDIICPDVEIKSIESACPGIEVKDDFTLVLKPGKKMPFLTHLLTAIDFAVIPRKSVDPKTLAIVDYKNTTGPYYVESSDDKGKIIFRANPGHYHYTKDLAQEIEFIPSGVGENKSSIDLYKEGKVDHIMTIDGAPPEKIIQFYKESGDASLHTTMDIRMVAIFFTERGMKELSSKERLSYGKMLKVPLASYFLEKPGYQNSMQFLAPFGDGQLSKEQQAAIEKSVNEIVPKTSGNGFELSMFKSIPVEQLKMPIEKVLPGIHVYQDNKVPAFTNYKSLKEIPHAFVANVDISFNEDISLITYAVNAGLFGMSKDEQKKWIKDYMSIMDKKQRLEKLQKLHFESLENGVLYPLVASPYIALLRKPWVSHLPQTFANNPLWTISRN
ncbi:MAG: hypothetical protein A2X86_15975 [Bdellovibrionales bacterium GWA2_49_15]|nr:MAG: hypothetical protein A2X86_15975 [Bdellovibrionales bacterium GWA2_49_15]HAZ13182.1 hypothetical protein [Bdellovibrionales bacterium]